MPCTQGFKRDGVHCPLTAIPFVPTYPDGVVPILSHVIPNSIHNKVSRPFP